YMRMQRKTDPNEGAMWTFEPSAALKIYEEMIAGENIEVRLTSAWTGREELKGEEKGARLSPYFRVHRMPPKCSSMRPMKAIWWPQPASVTRWAASRTMCMARI